MECANAIKSAWNSADAIQLKVEDAYQQLSALEQSILAKAFRGELVPQDPADEPASVLLERIRAQRAAEPVKRGRGKKQEGSLMTPTNLPLSGGGNAPSASAGGQAPKKRGRPKKVATPADDLPEIVETGMDEIEKQLAELAQQEALIKAALRARSQS
jgi:hypothetical protein